MSVRKVVWATMTAQKASAISQRATGNRAGRGRPVAAPSLPSSKSFLVPQAGSLFFKKERLASLLVSMCIFSDGHFGVVAVGVLGVDGGDLVGRAGDADPGDEMGEG
jgi:hypothetical protein